MWHILQIAIIVWLTYIYKTDQSPHTSMGHIFLFAVLVAYGVTWLLSKLIDLTALIFRRTHQFAKWLSDKNGSGPLRIN
jgi:hypothetical protein